jgi:molybdopterin converting factor small subunit
MRVEVKLFANFREYLPPGSGSYTRLLDLAEGTTIREVLENLKVPLSMPMILLVNGVYKQADEALQAGDVLSVFPPVAGG